MVCGNESAITTRKYINLLNCKINCYSAWGKKTATANYVDVEPKGILGSGNTDKASIASLFISPLIYFSLSSVGFPRSFASFCLCSCPSVLPFVASLFAAIGREWSHKQYKHQVFANT